MLPSEVEHQNRCHLSLPTCRGRAGTQESAGGSPVDLQADVAYEKTKIVYCKDVTRRGDYPNQSFDLLGFIFRARKAVWHGYRYVHGFQPAPSSKAPEGRQQDEPRLGPSPRAAGPPHRSQVRPLARCPVLGPRTCRLLNEQAGLCDQQSNGVEPLTRIGAEDDHPLDRDAAAPSLGGAERSVVPEVCPGMGVVLQHSRCTCAAWRCGPIFL
jgi:hypothetical protein